LAPDSASYVIPARNLAAGRGYVDDAGRPYSARPPTYSLFLALVLSLTGDSLRAVEAVQALLAAAGAAGLAFFVAHRQGVRAGVFTGILLATDPILIPVPAYVLTEALGTLLVAGIVLSLQQALSERRQSCLGLAGLLGGAAAFNTPIALLLVPWLLLTSRAFGSPRRPRWRAWALALGLVAACVGGWAARNYYARGHAIVVRDNGFGALVWATTEYDFDWLPSSAEPAWGALLRKFDAISTGRTEGEAHWIFLREAWRNLRTHPLLVMKRVVKANFWFWIEAPGSHLPRGLRAVRWATLMFHQLQLLGLVVALWLLWRAGELRRWTLWISSMVYFALFLSLMMPIPRYYVPVLPVMDTVIAAGLALLGTRSNHRRTAGGALPGGVGGAH
jgi:hypothetical protein